MGWHRIVWHSFSFVSGIQGAELLASFCLLVLAYYLTLKITAVRSSETSLNIYQINSVTSELFRNSHSPLQAATSLPRLLGVLSKRTWVGVPDILDACYLWIPTRGGKCMCYVTIETRPDILFWKLINGMVLTSFPWQSHCVSVYRINSVSTGDISVCFCKV
jgi:hypothetical protein